MKLISDKHFTLKGVLATLASFSVIYVCVCVAKLNRSIYKYFVVPVVLCNNLFRSKGLR